MSMKRINPFGDDDDVDFASPSAWGAARPNAPLSGMDPQAVPFGESASDILKDTIKKEAVIRDITASQGDLRALLSRVKTVQAEVDKLRSGNSTLQVYIENLNKQASKR